MQPEGNDFGFFLLSAWHSAGSTLISDLCRLPCACAPFKVAETPPCLCAGHWLSLAASEIGGSSATSPDLDEAALYSHPKVKGSAHPSRLLLNSYTIK